MKIESQEGTFPDACIVTNFSLNENGDIMQAERRVVDE